LGHVEWGEQAAYTNLWAGAFNTLVLLSSSLSAVLAHQAAEKGDGRKAAKLLYFTCLGGLVFLTVKSFERTHEIQAGFTLQSARTGAWPRAQLREDLGHPGRAPHGERARPHGRHPLGHAHRGVRGRAREGLHGGEELHAPGHREADRPLDAGRGAGAHGAAL